jgi:hypothetical protein
VGRFVIEFYDRGGFHRQRIRDGEDELGAVSVWTDEADSPTGWVNWGDSGLIDVQDAREVFDRLTEADSETVAAWCESNPGVRHPANEI